MSNGRFKSGEKLVAGVGYNSGVYQSVKVKEHALWRSMLARCYTERNLKKKPNYIGCTVSDNFKMYEFFYEWRNEQIGFNEIDENGRQFALDKDLLIKPIKWYLHNLMYFPHISIASLLELFLLQIEDDLSFFQNFKDDIIELQNFENLYIKNILEELLKRIENV